jgi:hypothetical protein
MQNGDTSFEKFNSLLTMRTDINFKNIANNDAYLGVIDDLLSPTVFNTAAKEAEFCEVLSKQILQAKAKQIKSLIAKYKTTFFEQKNSKRSSSILK